jgi:hypothetical protein
MTTNQSSGTAVQVKWTDELLRKWADDGDYAHLPWMAKLRIREIVRDALAAPTPPEATQEQAAELMEQLLDEQEAAAEVEAGGGEQKPVGTVMEVRGGKQYGWTGRRCPHCNDYTHVDCTHCGRTGDEYGEIEQPIAQPAAAAGEGLRKFKERWGRCCYSDDRVLEREWDTELVAAAESQAVERDKLANWLIDIAVCADSALGLSVPAMAATTFEEMKERMADIHRQAAAAVAAGQGDDAKGGKQP